MCQRHGSEDRSEKTCYSMILSKCELCYTVSVWVPLGLTPELQSCHGKVEHWVQLMCCPLTRLLLQILDEGWRLDVWRLRNVRVVTRTWRSEMEED